MSEAEAEASRRPDTTRDQRRDCQLMRRLGYTQSAISRELGLSLGQVQYALSHAETPITRPGRPSKLSEAQVEELKAFMAASPANERMPFAKIPQALGWDVGEYCIRHALRKLGHKRTAGAGRRRSGVQSVTTKKRKTTTAAGEAAEAQAAAVSASASAASESVPVSPSASALAAVAVAASASAASAASPTPSPAASMAPSPAAPVPGPAPGSGPGDEAEAEQA
ncbi:hypothetical protein MKX07_005102 [Trichoderma sp. CBMAI-0711]|uniref:Uncharacterized protein n=3 Tax=Trichoderma TaxID=5543 RepID=A0A2H2ZFN8_TRIPA|nr:hypothetical protein MKX07_005102 [Trichoderma sp. CBMAI-0711]OTA05823.1 hypothetical protein A9Z42_0065490 [Trichoderma parareesei]